MVDPIRVESSFQELMAELETTISIRYRYRLFNEFIKELNGKYQRFETYIIQLAEQIPDYSLPLTWSGLDPQEIEEMIDLFDNVSRELQLPQENEVFGEITIQLREVCILLYCCLNEFSKANDHLNSLCGLHFLLNKSNNEKAFSISECQALLKDAFSKSHNSSKEVRMTLQRLLNQIQFIQDIQFGKVLIPVVEKYEHSGSSQVSFGRLRLLSVEIYGLANHEDQIIRNFRMIGAEQPVNHKKQAALASARALFEFQYSKIKENFFRGGISFELSGAIHDGDSANFAISALWYSSLFEVTGQRKQYKVHPHVAITGDIDEKGQILAVDEQTIPVKVRAAFFSWTRQLVVPHQQRELFEEELQKLQEKYPQRKMDLIGINHLEEFFFDRRLAIHQVQGWFKYYFERAKSQKYRVVTIPLIILLFLMIGRLIFGSVDQNPVDAEFEGEHMLLTNQYGQELRSFRVGERVVNSVNQKDTRQTKVAFHDINHDGMNEVFFVEGGDDVSGVKQEELVAYSFSGDSILWSNNLKFDLHFPNKPSIGEDPFRVFNLLIIEGEESSSGNFLIVNAAHNNFFPSLLLNIDPITGKEKGRYLHTGYIYQLLAVDMNRDKKKELVALGVNNAFDNFVVVFVISLDKLVGHSPLTEEYKVAGYQRGEEAVYIRFPQTIVGRAFKKRVYSNAPQNIEANEEDSTIMVRVHDFRLNNPTPFEKNHADLFFYFDYDFEIQSIGTDSAYDLWAKNLYEEGLIPFEPDHEYFEVFKDSLLYWNGEEFVLKNN